MPAIYWTPLLPNHWIVDVLDGPGKRPVPLERLPLAHSPYVAVEAGMQQKCRFVKLSRTQLRATKPRTVLPREDLAGIFAAAEAFLERTGNDPDHAEILTGDVDA